MNKPTREHNGYEYLFAIKPEFADKWYIRNKRFILYENDTLTGQYLTTMWLNYIMTEQVDCFYEVMIIKVEVCCVRRNQIIRDIERVSASRNYYNIPEVAMYGVIDGSCLREAKNKISNILENKTFEMASVQIIIKLSVGDLNNDELLVSVQGFNKKNTDKPSIDKNDIVYSLTLPMFTTVI